jgi:hypothetical protein
MAIAFAAALVERKLMQQIDSSKRPWCLAAASSFEQDGLLNSPSLGAFFLEQDGRWNSPSFGAFFGERDAMTGSKREREIRKSDWREKSG